MSKRLIDSVKTDQKANTLATTSEKAYTAVGGFDTENNVNRALRMDGDGNLLIADANAGGAAVGGGDIVFTNAASDFDVAFGDADSIVITNVSTGFTVEAIHVASVERITTAGVKSTVPLTSVVVVEAPADTFTVTLADAEAAFVNTDTYVVYLIGPAKNRDASLDTEKTTRQNPEWAHYTAPTDILSGTPHELTAAFDETGIPEIAMSGYDQLGLYLVVDIGTTSTNVQMRILHKHESGGTDAYREIYLGSPAANITSINLNDYEVSTDADQKFKINIPVSATTPYVQIQFKDDANGDGQIDSLYVVKAKGA